MTKEARSQTNNQKDNEMILKWAKENLQRSKEQEIANRPNEMAEGRWLIAYITALINQQAGLRVAKHLDNLHTIDADSNEVREPRLYKTSVEILRSRLTTNQLAGIKEMADGSTEAMIREIHDQGIVCMLDSIVLNCLQTFSTDLLMTYKAS